MQTNTAERKAFTQRCVGLGAQKEAITGHRETAVREKIPPPHSAPSGTHTLNHGSPTAHLPTPLHGNSHLCTEGPEHDVINHLWSFTHGFSQFLM